MNLNKKEIRKKVIEVRDAMDMVDRGTKDKRILESLINTNYYKNSKVIFAFVSFGSEVDTKEFIQYALKDGKTIGVPKVKSKAEGIVVHKINSLDELQEGFYGILEPRPDCEVISSEDINFILMPGVAFDRSGGRIGYGGGFYDRFLSDLKDGIPKIAIAYEMQIIDNIPMEEFDVRIDGIITENEIIEF